MTQALRAKAGAAPPTEPPAVPPGPKAPPETPAPDAGGEPPAEPAAPPETPQTTPPAAPPKEGGKVNPWKLVDNYKLRLADLEKKLADAGNLPQAKSQEYLTKIEELTKRNEHLENEIRFVNFSESKEFKEKFDAPYQKAWERAMSDLQEITITDPQSGQSRAATAQDLADLLAVPLTKARELADQYFGNFADDIMAYRKELKSLFAARAQALDEAKKAGADRDKTQRELRHKQATETADFIRKEWEKSNQELQTHTEYGQYFAPVEGDQDGNQRLAKGFSLVDRAFNESPADPSLTPEQRAAVVKRHAAVRNRAAAFGRLVSMVTKLRAEKAELEKQLTEYKGSTPPAGGSATPPGTTPTEPATAHAQVFGALRKLAR